MNIGDMNVPFIYQGEELIHPNPVRDGLVLWYDFSGMTNEDVNKGVARDLSGNGNHGTLQNFNFTPESGYDKNKLLFDGVDDTIVIGKGEQFDLDVGLTLESSFNIKEVTNSMDLIAKGVTFGGAEGQNYSLAVFNNGLVYFEVINDGVRFNVTKRLNDYLGKNTLVQAVANNDGLTMFFNGELVSSRLGELTKILPVDVGLNISSNNRRINGKVYSTKIYNRALTPEEIAHNYAIEKERFGIE